MKLINISKTYKNKLNKVLALDNISLDIDHKGLYVIYGPSGSGKSTLLNIIAGIDKEYDGIYENDLKIAYLRQEFSLLEDLSVLDNLKLSNNTDKIDDFLKLLELEDIKDKKVRKLSNGQKRRVQLLSAILLKPEVLLLDEPTASLDHDNAFKIMSIAKELSRSMIVIVVSHDISIVSPFGDEIIYLDGGKLIKIDKKKELKENVKASRKTSKSFKDHVLFFSKIIKSRSLYYLVYILLITLTILALFFLSNLFLSIKGEDDYVTTFKTGHNIIESRGTKMGEYNTKEEYNDFLYGGACSFNQSVLPSFYENYNLIPYKDIVKLIEENKEIIAVEAFFSKEYSDSTIDLDNTIILDDEKESAYYSYEDKNDDFVNIKTQEGYLKNYDIVEDDLFLVDLDDYLETIQTGVIKGDFYPSTCDLLKENEIHLFTLVNDGTLPILMGDMPKNDDEILIDMNTAEKLLKMYELEDMEELLGKTVYPSAYSTRSRYKEGNVQGYGFMFAYFEGNIKIDDNLSLSDEEMSYLNKMRKNIDDYNDYLPFEAFAYKVSGITSVSNDDYNMVFVSSEFGHNQILDYYIKDLDNLSFDFVNIISDPKYDSKELVTKINDYFAFEDTEFFLQSDLVEGKNYTYSDPINFMPYILIILVILLITIIVYRLFDKKAIQNEKAFMKDKYYQKGLYLLIKGSSVFIITLSLSLLLSYPLVTYMNELSVKWGYATFMTYDLVYIIFAALIINLIVLIIELMFYKNARRKGLS